MHKLSLPKDSKGTIQPIAGQAYKKVHAFLKSPKVNKIV